MRESGASGGAVRNRTLGTVIAVAALAIAGEPSRADAPAREKVAAESISDEGGFQVVVVRGSTVSLVTGAESGEISEVTIREAPARSEERRDSAFSPPRLRETKRTESTTYYVFLNETSQGYPASFRGFAPIRHHRYGHLRHVRIKDGHPRIRHHGGLHRFPRSRPPVMVKATGARRKGSLARRF